MKARILRKLVFLFVASMLVGIQAESTARAEQMACPEPSGPLEIEGFGECSDLVMDIVAATDNTGYSCSEYCEYLTDCFYPDPGIVCWHDNEYCSTNGPEDYWCYCLCQYRE